MRFGFYTGDLDRGATASHGIFNYALELARRLPRLLGPDDEAFLLTSPAFLSEMQSIDGWCVELMPSPSSSARRLMNDNALLPVLALRHRLDIVHLPKGFVPLARLGSTAWVATVHDDIPFRYASGEFGRSARLRHAAVWRLLSRSGSLAATVIADTSVVAERLRVLHNFGTPIEVIPLAPAVEHLPFVPTSERSLGIVRFPSSFPHKRAREAEELIRSAVERLGLDAQHDTSFDEVVAKGSQGGIGDVLRQARCLVVSSIAEGFGLPALEAVALGVPVVAARTPVSEEVVGRWVTHYDAGDSESFSDALVTALSRDDDWLRRCAAEARAAFSWDATAKATLGVYRSAAMSRHTRRATRSLKD